jgi:DNA-binding SARP family transcriptional activator/ATP/maltotriose-dependent transcriptional regulator MalT
MDGADRAGTLKVEIGLLGPIEVVREGEAVALGGQKPRALLAMLALEPGRVVSVDALVEALWPGDPPDTAGHAIQVYVSQLRKVLGADTLVTRAPGYVLDVDAERVDLHRFGRLAREGRVALEAGDAASAEVALREALALWGGPALADFLYEPFAQTEIARLEELRTVVLEERIEADLILGRHAELVSELEALVQAQPLRERPRAQLMLALYRSGRQADALAAYRAARDTLVDELGIDPGPELRELEAAILRQDESLLLEAAPLARPAMQYRRLVTIVFVDVVESMALAEALDPEALGAVLRSYFETVSAAIVRHGGTVEKYAGDAVMAAFGIPVAHEDDALRAARAALDIRLAAAALNEQLALRHGVGLELRTGIEAGEVVATPTDARQRLVTGEAVGIASKLEAAAGADEIVVGEVAARLIDHAARLEPLGALEIKGLSRPVGAFRLLALEEAAPAFERRLDAPLVGRKRELAALRRSLKRAIDSGSTRIAVVVAPPGVGKSRLAAEFTRRAKGVTALWGRCLSYGDGITYWPLREALAEAGESEERDAVLAALEAETPPPAPELAWLFRRFCEASARERPLVLVFDDVHWAEPTFLELVEHLADKGEAPINVVCLAREELDETRPSFLEGRANVDRIEPDALSTQETEALVDALGGTILESDQRTRLVETAEGNPLFLEQLLALALEGGLVAERLPETIQALLAARLDRLGPGERAVLERGAVVGKEFTAEDVVALLDPDAAPTAGAHLATLAGRGFVRPGADAVFGFRHVLVQDAVYRAAPKRLRAELHERYADRLDSESPDLPDLDEFVGYHLEQAFRLRTELGESDRRTEGLAEGAGRRLGEAGFRGLKRGDMPATVALLGRAVSLLRRDAESRYELMSELAIAEYVAGRASAARATLLDAIAGAESAGQRRVELRARIEAAYLRLLTEPEGAANDLLATAEAAVPVFEALADDRSLARAWLLIGYVHGGIHGNHAAWEEAEERALSYYRTSGFPATTCIGQIAAALYWGPTPVRSGIQRCTDLLAEEPSGRFERAAAVPYLGGLHAQEGRFAEARRLVAEAERTYAELGSPGAGVHCGTVRADIEFLAGDLDAAEQTLRDQCAYLASIGDRAHLAVRAAKLADALFRQGQVEEAEEWAALSRANAASDDQSAQLILGLVEAKLLAWRGEVSEARGLAQQIVRLAESTDGLNLIAAARVALAEVLRTARLEREAQRSLREAVALFERKGNTVAASQARELIARVVPA